MQPDIQIRESHSADVEALVELYPRAFPEEDLIPVLHDLLAAEENVFSLVAVRDEAVVGHVGFSICGVDGQSDQVGMLAPLAIHPDHQRQGIGSALVNKGFDRLKTMGVNQACVLGDPDYYGRFGFETERDIFPPYKLPAEWEKGWQSVKLNDGAASLSGKLLVPSFWQHPHLWMP